MKPNQKCWTLNVEAKGLKFDLRINDVSLASNSEATPFKLKTIINEWLLHGENRIQVLITDFVDAIEVSAQPPTATPEADAFLSCSIRDLDEQDPNITGLYEYHWPNEKQPFPQLPAATPSTERVFLIDDSALGNWSFLGAPTLSLTPRLEAEATAFVAGIQKALSNKDLPRLATLCKLRNSERARALGREEASFAKKDLDEWSQLFSEDSFAMWEIAEDDPSVLKFFPCWDSKLLLITDLEDYPPIMTKPAASGLCISTAVYVARIGNALTWVR